MQSSNIGQRRSLNAKNFSEAYKITSQRWFPCAPGTLNRVRERIVAGFYRDNKKELLRDLRSDASLFLYSLRKLRRLIVASGGSGSHVADGDTNDLLIDSIGEIVDELENKAAHHSFELISELQTGRYKEMILSATVTDSLAERLAISKNVGFTCALLRQLGLTLIAWNYPNIYRQSVDLLAAERPGSIATLDSILHSQLGFSPAMLGIRFAEVSGLPDAIVRELDTEQPARPDLDQLADHAREGRPGVISQLCLIGEAFARANNPKHYPNARADLDASSRAISGVLGADGTKIIVERTKSIYGQVVPALIGGQALLSGHENLAAEAIEHGRKNSNITSAPQPLRARIESIYDRAIPGRIDEELIRELVHEIVPLMGFGAIVVFTADPVNSALNPVLRVGRPSFIQVRRIPLAWNLTDSNPVRRAYSSGVLVYESGHLENGERRSLAAAAIGSKIRAGVLYLETGGTGAKEGYQTAPVPAAKLLAACLEDLLQLG